MSFEHVIDYGQYKSQCCPNITTQTFGPWTPNWHALVPGLVAYVHRRLRKELGQEPSLEDVAKETKRMAMLFTGESF